MRNKWIFTCMLTIGAMNLSINATNGVTQCGTDTGQKPFPVEDYTELPDHSSPIPDEWKVKKLTAMWGSSDMRYAMHQVPSKGISTSIALTAWKGESVNAQAVVWTHGAVKSLSYEISELKNGKHTLPASSINTGFVRYVMTDELNKNGGGCGHRQNHQEYDSTLVADAIDRNEKELPMKAMSTRAIWVKFTIPSETKKGTYKGYLKIKENEKIVKTLPISIKVLDRTLPPPSDWSFHLDLWQNPFSVARYYNLPLWSKAHFEAMRPFMTRLANA